MDASSIMDTSLQSLAVRRTLRGCENLIAALSAMPEDKRNWRPMGSGRTANDLLAECVLVNLKWAASLRSRVYTRVSAETEASIRDIAAVSEEMEDRLRASAAELVQAIQSIRDDELADMIEAPFGAYSLADCCLIAYWNCAYHEGQINYIQTLYGDQVLYTAF